jgi:hypothetical protein
VTYVDQDDEDIPNLSIGRNVLRTDIEALYWSATDQAFWLVNTVIGTVDYPAGVIIYYETDDCTGPALTALSSLQQVVYGPDGAGDYQYWAPGAAYTPATCYTWAGLCSLTACPMYGQLVSLAGSVPDLSVFAPPFHLQYVQ